MECLETYYLIDFENVHENGLFGAEKLAHTDHVHLFSTKNAPKISIETLTKLNSVRLFTHEIQSGSQSLDMHLVSYLGYMIGQHHDTPCKFVIISKDRDYDNVIAFWQKNNNVDIERRTAIEIQKKKSTPSIKQAKVEKIKTSPKTIPARGDIQLALEKANFEEELVSEVLSIVEKHYFGEKSALYIHNELRARFENYLDLYKVVKPFLSTSLSKEPEKKISSKVLLHNEIQKTLSDAKLVNDTINTVASIVVKHFTDDNAKQGIHRLIVAKYGQKEGTRIYNYIKDKL